MRRIIALAVVLGLTSGLLGAFAYGELFGEAEAQSQPRGQRVLEQNLDADGLIRVHEQGTANVNVTNTSLPVSGTVDVGNLPAVQDVNVVSLPANTAGPPFLYQIANNLTVPVGITPIDVGAFDVQGCTKFSVLTIGTPPPSGAVVSQSTDGINRFPVIVVSEGDISRGTIGEASGIYRATEGAATTLTFQSVMKMLSVKFVNGTASPITIVEAHIYCE